MKDFENYIPEGHKDIEVYHIGTIDFSNKELFNEAEIAGKIRLNQKSIGVLKIEVYPNEGSIPHFHIFTLDKNFESCICIYSANYFGHGGKYLGKFNSKQCEKLNEYLKEPAKTNPNISVWDSIMNSWEVANPSCKFPQNRKIYIQPDYSKMTDYKDY